MRRGRRALLCVCVLLVALSPASLASGAPATANTAGEPPAMANTASEPPAPADAADTSATPNTAELATENAAEPTTEKASRPTTAESVAGATPGPRIVAVYPNPVGDGDPGEFVVLDVPETYPAFVLTDGESTAGVPANASGPVVVTADPDVVRRLARTKAGDSVLAAGVENATVLSVPTLALANGGERLRLRRDGRVIDEKTYGDASEGETGRYGTDERQQSRADASRGVTSWRPLGFEPQPVGTHGPADATAFVLPDAPDVPLTTLRGAERRILLAGYTFTSERIADALVAAARRGVRVRVLVEGAPVGGLSRREARLLDRLVTAGVDVRAVGGPYARVEFHHAKYAVVDDRALVLTENWKPAGTGGASSRGWGVRVDAPAVAADLAALFRRDAGWRDAVPWRRFRRGRRFEPGGAANGSYPARLAPRRTRVQRLRVLTAPDNAEGAVVGVVDNASSTVDVLQPTVERESTFVRASLRAAERGVRVRILLSGAWYAAEENRRIVAALNDYAARNDLPLTARIAQPNGRFEKVHAKGLVVDGDTVVLGSLNWNSHSARANREVVVALKSEAAAQYYGRAFAADWRGGGRRLPAGVVVGVAVALGVAVAAVRREVAFGE